jgi:hypothetical protein
MQIQLIDRFETYESVEALRRKLRSIYDATAILEDLAVEKGIPIHAPFRGRASVPSLVMAPTLGRYFDLIVDSAKTPEAVEESALDSALSSIFRAVKAATAYIKSLWGEEYFPPEPTSRENEMSVVQSAVLNGHRVMLTGDAGREALQEVIDYAPFAGLALPGIRYFRCLIMAGGTMSRQKFWINWLVHGWTVCRTSIPGMPFAVLPKPMRITRGSP